MRLLLSSIAAIVLFMAAHAQAIGIEHVLAPDPDDRPLVVRIWYPDAAQRGDEPGSALHPLVIMSHGAGGTDDGHEDTARALAEAGFVVAAVAHTGDNYKDQRAVKQGRHLAGRPRHVSRTIDYMLSDWRAHGQIDPQRIGVFGFSSGGFTALVMAQGQPDLSRIAKHCEQQPTAWDCEYLARHDLAPQSIQSPPSGAWIGDPRIKAAVIAAPAVAYSFEPDGLAQVRIPIQLWGAQRDEIIGDGAEVIRRLLPLAPEYHQVDKAGHFAFLAPCSRAMRIFIGGMALFGTESICSDPPDFDRLEFHRRFNAEVVRFFSTKLRQAESNRTPPPENPVGPLPGGE